LTPEPPAAPPVPPAAAPPPAPPPPVEAATADDVRALRRWLLVAGAWAVAATAIAVIALIQANKDDSAKIGARTASQVGHVQRQLSGRLDDIENRLDGLAPTGDVTRLDRRLKKAEDDTAKATAKLDKLSGRVDDLENRVDDLESQQSSQTDTTPTNTDETP
jgi:polyhydroxyalkanoate synthesis regulator phasin